MRPNPTVELINDLGAAMRIWAKVGLGLGWGVFCASVGINPFLSVPELLLVSLPPFCVALRMRR